MIGCVKHLTNIEAEKIRLRLVALHLHGLATLASSGRRISGLAQTQNTSPS